MRLLRRTILCLVVGATAFGVAGWMFRPKANWVVECGPKDAEVSLLNPERAVESSEPIWIKQTIRTDDMPIDLLVALDPRNGQEIRRWTLTYNEARDNQYFGAPGQLIATCSGKGTTKFRVFDARTGVVVERELPTFWVPGGAGTSAWRFTQQAKDDALQVVDLVSGEIKTWVLTSHSSRLFGRQPYGDLAPDGRRFVARAIGRDGRLETPSFHVWSLDPLELLDEVKVPLSNETHLGQIDSVRWIDGGRFIEVKVSAWRKPDDRPHEHEIWIYDPTARKFDSPPAEPRRGEAPVPGADAEVVVGYELGPISTVPESLLERLPDSWRETGAYRMRWRRQSSAESRDVGCRHVLVNPQVRPDAVVTMCQSAGTPKSLESWPLPPRDPKWAALGVSALCVAATWWLCARSANRKAIAGAKVGEA